MSKSDVTKTSKFKHVSLDALDCYSNNVICKNLKQVQRVAQMPPASVWT